MTRLSRAERGAAERAHGDAIMVDFDSPEALEEVFWRTFCGTAYIRSDRLTTMQADAETIDRFRRYVGSIHRRYGSHGISPRITTMCLEYRRLWKRFLWRNSLSRTAIHASRLGR